MTDNGDELVSLGDAPRIIMKVPPQEPCDSDDTIDAGEQDASE